MVKDYSNKVKKLLLLTAISGCLAVIIGAFGAHTLVDKIPPESLTSYKTGVSYQFYHTLAAMLSLLFYIQFKSRLFIWATSCFLIGIVFFSGSIYLLTTKSITGIFKTSILGPITPIGGMFFIIAWIFLLIGFTKVADCLNN